MMQINIDVYSLAPDGFDDVSREAAILAIMVVVPCNGVDTKVVIGLVEPVESILVESVDSAETRNHGSVYCLPA